LRTHYILKPCIYKMSPSWVLWYRRTYLGGLIRINTLVGRYATKGMAIAALDHLREPTQTYGGKR
jgi:hypothetical protein